MGNLTEGSSSPFLQYCSDCISITGLHFFHIFLFITDSINVSVIFPALWRNLTIEYRINYGKFVKRDYTNFRDILPTFWIFEYLRFIIWFGYRRSTYCDDESDFYHLHSPVRHHNNMWAKMLFNWVWSFTESSIFDKWIFSKLHKAIFFRICYQSTVRRCRDVLMWLIFSPSLIRNASWWENSKLKLKRLHPVSYVSLIIYYSDQWLPPYTLRDIPLTTAGVGTKESGKNSVR